MRYQDGDEGDDGSEPGQTEQVNLEDADVSMLAADVPFRGTAPPPLPASVSRAPSPSQAPPPPHAPSYYPSPSQMPPPPAPRRPWVYVALGLTIVVVALGSGAVVATYLRRNTSTAVPTPAATSTPAVITIPTVEMDDADGGP